MVLFVLGGGVLTYWFRQKIGNAGYGCWTAVFQRREGQEDQANLLNNNARGDEGRYSPPPPYYPRAPPASPILVRQDPLERM